MSIYRWLGAWLEEQLGHQLDEKRLHRLLTVIGRPRVDTTKAEAWRHWTETAAKQDVWNEIVTATTNHESSFFREPALYRFFEAEIERRIAKGAVPVRVLSAGCSAGQEIYTCAIVAHRRWGSKWTTYLDLHGVDIDEAILARARRGSYRSWDLRGLPDEERERYFASQTDATFVLTRQLSSAVTFRRRNILTPATRNERKSFDIVLMRNVLVHLTPRARTRATASMASLVKPSGLLLLAASETANVVNDSFVTEEDQGFFYLRCRPATGIPVDTLEQNNHRTNIPRRALPTRRLKSAARLLSPPQLLSPPRMVSSGAPVPTKPQRPIVRCFTAYSAGDFVSACTYCQQALSTADRLSPEEEGALQTILGLSLQARGETKNACVALSRAVLLTPLCWVAHFHYGEALRDKGCIDKAQRQYEQARRCLEHHGTVFLDELYIDGFTPTHMAHVCQERIHSCTMQLHR